jgi:RecJ-like exonuclease
LKEFSTLLNSCGRMHKPSLGIGTCLGDKESYEEALKLSSQYKTELIESLNWFYKNRNSSSIIETPEVVIINSEDKVKDTLIGTVTSMISKSNVYKPETIIISLAHTIEQNTKISIRVSGYNTPDIDLKEILDNITQKMGYSAGGHNFAAGSLIPQEKEKEFINLVLETFKKQTETIILN